VTETSSQGRNTLRPSQNFDQNRAHAMENSSPFLLPATFLGIVSGAFEWGGTEDPTAMGSGPDGQKSSHAVAPFRVALFVGSTVASGRKAFSSGLLSDLLPALHRRVSNFTGGAPLVQ
jgi:hypothetical protein